MTTATEEKTKIRREIQPKDAQGNPIGSPHVYEGESEQEVMDKMAAAIANGTAKIRSLSEEKEKFADLLTAPATVPEGAEMAPPPLKRRDLTPEEKLEISNMLRDPGKVQDAYARLYEAETGRKPSEDAREREQQAEITRVKNESEMFCQAHPEFYSTPRNGVIMVNYLEKRGMRISFKNFEIAFRELDKSGLLERFPEPPPEEKPVPAPRTEAAAETPQAVPTTAFPSSIRSSQASGSGPSATPKSKMPSAEEFAALKPDAKRDLLKAHGLWGASTIPAGVDIANPRTWTKLRRVE